MSLVLVGLAGGIPEYVDSGPAKAVADRFYDALATGDVGIAMNQFSASFRKEVEIWPEFLTSMDKRFGPVTSRVLGENQLAANEHEPCFVLTYSVARARLQSSDKLLVCRISGEQDWKIFGHYSTRSDTGQTLRGGIMPTSTPLSEKGS